MGGAVEGGKPGAEVGEHAQLSVQGKGAWGKATQAAPLQDFSRPVRIWTKERNADVLPKFLDATSPSKSVGPQGDLFRGVAYPAPEELLDAEGRGQLEKFSACPLTRGACCLLL